MNRPLFSFFHYNMYVPRERGDEPDAMKLNSPIE